MPRQRSWERSRSAEPLYRQDPVPFALASFSRLGAASIAGSTGCALRPGSQALGTSVGHPYRSTGSGCWGMSWSACILCPPAPSLRPYISCRRHALDGGSRAETHAFLMQAFGLLSTAMLRTDLNHMRSAVSRLFLQSARASAAGALCIVLLGLDLLPRMCRHAACQLVERSGTRRTSVGLMLSALFGLLFEGARASASGVPCIVLVRSRMQPCACRL